MTDDRQELAGRVRAALQAVKTGAGADVVAAGHVQNLEADADGVVRFQFVLGAEDPGSLVREARAVAEGVDGVAKVKIDVRLPNAPQQPQGGRRQPGSVPAPTPDAALVSGIGHVIAISSGTGGVGKPTVAANLAAALAAAGRRVGLLDADVYGPNIPLMFGEKRKPRVTGERGAEKILPLESHGVKLMSLGFLLDDEQPAIMRGPLVSGILKQFLEQVEWGELDYLIVDMPPGTGDAQLSLVQLVSIDGALMVTTPQDVATGDVRRAVRMFERVDTRIFGIVENMTGMTCPHCSGHIDVFGSGGGSRLAEDMHLPLLCEIPLDPRVREAGDSGTPTALALPDSPAGAAFRDMAGKLIEAVESEQAGVTR
ncbi:MAG TPA: Mrp/NBP35 family ATP-binding protein [Longimicrobiales bacterium]|nr:Mrp/NBP35 family ATP-binding protein [Longimicrobiales bacterium]